jgi:hypothetical protein
MSLIPKDAKKFNEKIVYILAYGIATVAYVVGLLCGFNVIPSQYGDAVHKAGIVWNIFGLVLVAAAVIYTIKLANDDVETGRGSVAVSLVLVVLSLAALCGFQS